MDNQHELVLRTDNPLILDLGKLPSDTIFDVSVTLYNNKNKKRTKENATGDKI